MIPEIFRSSYTGEEYRLYHHPSGLDIMIMKLEGFRTVEALFGTKYGSVNNCFRTLDTGDFIRVPDGIAHYLEHKLFENEECGVFELYAATGATANAFTSFDVTAYTFSTSSDYREPLRILLDFVQKPYFTEENVEKERGIIAQEIKMSEDSPSRALFFELLNCLYKEHPIKIDIAGSVESIQEITPELLYKCYDTFYNLNNMALAIAGNIDDETVLAICDECLKPAEDKRLEIRFPDEPAEVARPRSDIKREIGVPMFSLGFKCPPLSGSELQKTSIAAEMMLKLMFGQMSPWHKRVFEQGLINSTFGTEVFSSDVGVFAIILTGESKDPDAVYQSIIEEIEACRSRDIDERLFNAMKKSGYAGEVQKYNIVSECADSMMFGYMLGSNCFDTLEVLSGLTTDDIKRTMELLDPQRSSFCTVSSDIQQNAK
ncbi:MAG: insulinase family protein [Ruminococcus sp.]|nr:insulinase family protein [Ruminococcus sp.]